MVQEMATYATCTWKGKGEQSSMKLVTLSSIAAVGRTDWYQAASIIRYWTLTRHVIAVRWLEDIIYEADPRGLKPV